MSDEGFEEWWDKNGQRISKEIQRILTPFWKKVSVGQVEGVKCWRIELKKKRGLTYIETKACAYALLDEILPKDDSIKCLVNVM